LVTNHINVVEVPGTLSIHYRPGLHELLLLADSLIKVLESFCGQNLTTKKGDKRLNMYLVEERATATHTANTLPHTAQHQLRCVSIITITITAPLSINHGDPKHYTPVT
jgi:hypothetical protein